MDLREALPAFPGAEGFGTDTPAGRGGTIIAVTTLAAKGPGYLRDGHKVDTPPLKGYQIVRMQW